MAYLNCPTCRLTVYSPLLAPTREECPRCKAKLGRVSRLFRSSLPPRLLDEDGADAQERGQLPPRPFSSAAL
ncbi:MAG TPA: hypothetical protein VK307_06195 [Thermoleophilaceae bacterium]|nr:hypothetical protein [Thermoleophilaceae bacterium]